MNEVTLVADKRTFTVEISMTSPGTQRPDANWWWWTVCENNERVEYGCAYTRWGARWGAKRFIRKYVRHDGKSERWTVTCTLEGPS